MATVYAVDVNVNLLNGGGGGFGGGALNANALTQLNQQFGILQNNISRTRSASQSLMGIWGQLFVTREIMRFGGATLGVFGGMIKAAADFQTAMGGVQMATGASVDQMQTLSDAVVRISQTHAMDLTETANMIAVASKGGIKDPAMLMALLNPDNGQAGIADFADVMRITNKIPVEQSAKMGMEFATLLGGQDPSSILTALDAFTRAASFSPEGPMALFETFKKLHPLASKLGANPRQELQVAALLGESGLRGAGGRETASALLKMATAGPKSNAKARALDKELLGARDSRGGLDLVSMLEHLGKFEREHPKDALKTEKDAFGQVGLRALAVLADPKHIAQLEKMVTLWDKMPGLHEQHIMQMEQVNAQWTVFTTDLTSLGAVLGTDILPTVTSALQNFNGVLEWSAGLLREHPLFRKEISNTAVLGAGGATIAIGAAGLMFYAALAKMASGAVVGTAAEATLAGSATTAAAIAAGAIAALPAVLALGAGYIIGYFTEQAIFGPNSQTGKGQAYSPTSLQGIAIEARSWVRHLMHGGDAYESDFEKSQHKKTSGKEGDLNFFGDNHFHGVQDVDSLHNAVKQLSKNTGQGLFQGATTHSVPATHHR